MAKLNNSSKDYSGYLIVFEGIDGTGKTTHANLLQTWIEDLGFTCLLEKEPTDGIHGRKLRDSATSGRLNANEELELFHKDRKEHVEKVITPALSSGKFVIIDRYYFSTMAYQGARGFDPQALLAENEKFAPRPDLLLVMDLTVDQSLDRIGARGDIANEFEGRESLTECRIIFHSVLDFEYAERICSNRDKESVQKEIRNFVEKMAPEINSSARS